MDKLITERADLLVENIFRKKIFTHKPGIKPGYPLFFGWLIHSILQKSFLEVIFNRNGYIPSYLRKISLVFVSLH
ncbi:MAG: hypothetical protein STSR0004_12790 [Peptococcaceae bacterium]